MSHGRVGCGDDAAVPSDGEHLAAGHAAPPCRLLDNHCRPARRASSLHAFWPPRRSLQSTSLGPSASFLPLTAEPTYVGERQC